MSEQKIYPNASPKLSFVFGLITGLAIFSVIGFFVLLFIIVPKKEGSDKAFLGLGGGDKNGQVAPAETNNNENNQPSLTFANIADDLKLDIKKFNECLENNQTAEKVGQDYQKGMALGVQGTPASYINGVLVAGAYPYEEVKKIIDGLIDGSIKPIENENLKILSSDYILGNKNAKISIFEFSDFQCPYCGVFHPNINQALAEYQDKIRVVFRHFPLTSIHPKAQKAAEATECAGIQGKFWEYADELFENQGKW